MREALNRTESYWLLLALVLPVACGGSVRTDPQPVGPVHDGVGQYTLRIERVHDDCVPASPSGDEGQVIVVVATGLGADGQSAGANIPTAAAPVGTHFEAQRSDIAFDRPLSIELPSSLPGCMALRRSESSTLAANGAGIDVEWKDTWTGLASCRAGAFSVASDCTSDRIFHFEWLRACGPGSDVSHCQ